MGLFYIRSKKGKKIGQINLMVTVLDKNLNVQKGFFVICLF